MLSSGQCRPGSLPYLSPEPISYPVSPNVTWEWARVSKGPSSVKLCCYPDSLYTCQDLNCIKMWKSLVFFTAFAYRTRLQNQGPSWCLLISLYLKEKWKLKWFISFWSHREAKCKILIISTINKDVRQHVLFAEQMGVWIGTAIWVYNLGGSVKCENVQTPALFTEWRTGNKLMAITGERETMEWSRFLYTSMTNVLS